MTLEQLRRLGVNDVDEHDGLRIGARVKVTDGIRIDDSGSKRYVFVRVMLAGGPVVFGRDYLQEDA